MRAAVVVVKRQFGGPAGGCWSAEGRRKESDKRSTRCCIVVDAAGKRLWACKGTPCGGQFREYAWDRPAKLAQWSGLVKW